MYGNVLTMKACRYTNKTLNLQSELLCVSNYD